jgi:hypothetical protein
MSVYLDECKKTFYFHLPVAVVQNLKLIFEGEREGKKENLV